jgi:hypothetical protein
VKHGLETTTKRLDIAKWQLKMCKTAIHGSTATEILSTAGSDGRKGRSFRCNKHVNCNFGGNETIALFHRRSMDDLLNVGGVSGIETEAVYLGYDGWTCQFVSWLKPSMVRACEVDSVRKK